jgi:hypothetical protein
MLHVRGKTGIWSFSLLFPQVVSSGLPFCCSVTKMVNDTVPDLSIGSGPGLTYLTQWHCCRTGHNAHQRQIASLCKNHQETLPGTYGCHP